MLVKRRFGIDISTTAIYKFYKKKGIIFRPQKRLPWYQPIKEAVIPKAPGDVVQMDAKYIWEDNTRKYQRTFIDIYTGIQFASVTSTMTAEDTINAVPLKQKNTLSLKYLAYRMTMEVRIGRLPPASWEPRELLITSFQNLLLIGMEQ